MLLMVSAVSYFGTVGSMLTAVTVQVIIQSIVLLLYLNYRFKGYWKCYDSGVMREQLKYALPFGFMGILWIMQSEAHNFFIMSGFSSEEMGIYAIGCFELPLLAILYESVSSVMIPRMSELQSKGKVREMIELSVRAWEKLSVFYFPTYVIFLITAQTFITTLFTERYITAVPIFLINITLLPSYIFITDPIVRAYEHLGRFILKIRIVVVILMLGTLWFGRNYLDLTGVIAVVVITAFIERAITLYKIWKFVGFKMEDFALMKNISRIGLIAAFSGIPAIAVYTLIKFQTSGFGQQVSMMVYGQIKPQMAEFASGALILSVTGIVYAAFYIGLLTYFKIISENDREFVKEKLGFVFRFIGRG
jgi:O-antigen/teichoic acid export membrane protein